MEERHLRTAQLLGEAGVHRLQKAHVAVFGLGGVGGYAAEALARAGVGALSLFDADVFSPSNLNRQLCAVQSTLGQPKAQVFAAHIAGIDPDVRVQAHRVFYLPETAQAWPLDIYDYVLDAVDTVAAKLELAMRAYAAGVPIISAMGCGNKLDPTAFAEKTRRAAPEGGVQHRGGAHAMPAGRGKGHGGPPGSGLRQLCAGGGRAYHGRRSGKRPFRRAIGIKLQV